MSFRAERGISLWSAITALRDSSLPAASPKNTSFPGRRESVVFRTDNGPPPSWGWRGACSRQYVTTLTPLGRSAALASFPQNAQFLLLLASNLCKSARIVHSKSVRFEFAFQLSSFVFKYFLEFVPTVFHYFCLPPLPTSRGHFTNRRVRPARGARPRQDVHKMTIAVGYHGPEDLSSGKCASGKCATGKRANKKYLKSKQSLMPGC